MSSTCRVAAAASLTLLVAIGCQSSDRAASADPFLDTSAAVLRSQVVVRANGPDEQSEPAGTSIVPATFTPAEPRVFPARYLDCPVPRRDLAGCPPGHAHVVPHPNAGAADRILTRQAPGGPCVFDPHDYRDEYLCDGGDRAYPVHYDAFNRLGLDTEDTVAEFVDSAGNRTTKPTNRVCVYAPRFAAVLSVDATGAEQMVQGPSLEARRTGGVGIRTRLAVNAHAQRLSGVGVRVRSRPSGVDADVGRDAIDQVNRAAGHTKLVNLYENLVFLRSGRMLQEERPSIARRVDAAVTWAADVAPFVVATTTGGAEVRGTFEAQQLIGLDPSNRKPGELRIVKMADKKSAQRGDVVTFTIRYDNLGDEPLHHLRIVDNLTPRLEYVDDSADSDRRGRLVVEENGEGSLVLTFEVTEPITGKTGGVVSFKTRVR